MCSLAIDAVGQFDESALTLGGLTYVTSIEPMYSRCIFLTHWIT